MKLTTREVAVFAMLGAIMYASKMIMEIAPNVHLLGTFVIAFTLVYGKKALYPIYVFVLLTGVYAGFATWWVPYLYLWTVLWGVIMLLPKNMPKITKSTEIPKRKGNSLLTRLLFTVSGVKIALRPKTKSKLQMFEPTTLPRAILAFDSF